jgi:thiol-disulfide isomerase/thioredoxin/uncharacterized membrane protein
VRSVNIILVILLRSLLVVAIAASCALVIEYQSYGDPAFCGAGSACAQVRNSDVAQKVSSTVGVSLPQVGLIAFVVLLGASLMIQTRLHVRLFAVAAGLGGVVAVALLLVQRFQVGVFCKWCVAVDVAMIGAAVCAVALAWRARPSLDEPAPWSAGAALGAWAVAGALAVALPFVWNELRPLPQPPPALEALQVPGKITIVQFTDFECPHCRALHPVFAGVKQTHGDRIVLLRKMVPLDVHPGAGPAALAYLCTPDDKREAMADVLYRALPADMQRPGVIASAGELGIDRPAFERCLDAPATKEALQRDRALYDGLETKGVPQSYVGGKLVLGNNPSKLLQAVERAAAGRTTVVPVPLLVALFLAGLVGAAAITWRTARARLARTQES